MIKVRNFLVLLRGQLWLIPALSCLVALGVAYAVLSSRFGLRSLGSADLWWLFGGDARTARDLLSALLSGTMTMTSLVVSMTFVTLTLAANQLGPRLIWNFIEDRQIQIILGVFLGTIFYIVVVLRTLDDRTSAQDVPHTAVTLASFLTLACLLALLFYVHKIARAIIADTVIENVSRDLHASLNNLLPVKGRMNPVEKEEATPPHAGWVSIGRAGYVQSIDYDALLDIACKADIIFRIHVRAGHFLLRSGKHVEILSPHPVDGKITKAVRDNFIMGPERSAAQDLEYSLRQLVEVALRALSSGINDPFTAMSVIDRLGAAIEAIAEAGTQPGLLYDKRGHLRLVASHSDSIGLVNTCFDQIRQSSLGQPAVLVHIADTLGKLGGAISDDNADRAILDQLESLSQAAHNLPFKRDREQALQRIDAARESVMQSLAFS